MRSPEEFLREVNRRSIQMSQQARRSGSKRGRKNCQKGIETQVSVMENMLNELLEYARGETGSTVVLRRMAHSDFVRQTLPELQNELKCQGVNLVMENAPPSAPVLLDPVRLSHVYRNILSNARDAMPKGGTVTVRFREEEGVIVTEIEDGETGIAPEIAPMLFEPFATYGKSRGTGLGLSICERIVQSHSGSIRAFNSPKGGAVFAFSLPVREAKDSPETTAP
jgi:signal transduction histidine kinase